MYTVYDEIIDGAIDFLAGLACSELANKDYEIPLVLLEIVDEYH